MRKFLAALLGVVCVSCVVAATACTGEPNYYLLTYADQDGVQFDFGDIQSGAEVREGYTVTFTVDIDEGLEGEPVVQLNSGELTPNADGVYSFVMEQESTVSVTGVLRTNTYKVTFEAGDNRIRYFSTDENKTELTDVAGLHYNLGDQISFTLTKSVYYTDDDFQVTANTTILKPDANGVYTFDVQQDTNVSVSGLVQEEGFANRAGCGTGTADDPYLISRPIDLFYIAALVENSFYQGRFAMAHYKLTADIDMQGEQLYIIGEYPEENSIATFMGEFDGNGHTISNYYIEDHIINQDDGEEIPLHYIGLFGVASATSSSAVSIHDLTLKDFEIVVDGANLDDAGFYVGGLVGFGMGVEITNCHVSGTITAYGNSDTFGYVGGIIGRQQSFYASEDLYYYSNVDSCSSAVEITCSQGNFYAAGGISAIAISAAESASSNIINSYFTGNVSGAMNAGGIVGISDSYTSVVNCYSTGEVFARSTMGVLNGQYTYSHASAGGIVGQLGSDAIVANCFSVSDVSASAMLGTNYRHTGGIAGRLDESGGLFVNSVAPVQHNNYSGSEVGNNAEFYKNSLGWSDGVWSFEGEYPVIKQNPETGYNVTVVFTGNKAVNEQNTKSYTGERNVSISDLYRERDGKAEIDRFLTSDDGLRSYGYFFDSELKNPVPLSYVPLGNVTLYVGFADYSEVAGTYFITGGGNSNYITLGIDGSFNYRQGALEYTTYYIYDGKTVTLQPSPASMITVGEGEDASTSYVYATAEKGESLEFEYIYRTSSTDAPATGSFTAVVKHASFEYGTYYAEGSDDYTFNFDGTGRYGNVAFTFTFNTNGSIITITLANGNRAVANVTDDGLTISNKNFTKYDVFRGLWEKSYTTHETYSFDGKGGWTSEKFVYDKDGEPAHRVTETGAYTIADGVIAFNGNCTASFDADGNLEIFNGVYSEKYYRENSFVGEWRFLNVYEPITLSFGGLNGEGYGKATVKYANADDIVMNYEVLGIDGTDYIYLFLGDEIYGQLTFNAGNETLNGIIYSVLSGGLKNNVLFCLYDEFKGLWLSTEFGEIEFNGLGNYDIAGTGDYTRAQGVIKINGRTAGAYKLEKSLMTGEFTYRNITYTIVYNPATGNAEITAADTEETSVLVKPDEMHGLVLVDGDGNRYSFDGGSALVGGGKLTVGEEEYVYTPSANGYSVGETGSLVIEDGFYKITLGSAEPKVLTLENPFTGSWDIGGVRGGSLVSGIRGGSLVIDEINADKRAAGKYLGVDVVFTYNAEGGYLSFTHANATLYVLAFGSTEYELAISAQPNSFGEYVMCLKEGNLDEYAGEYVAGDGSKIVLDGFTVSKYGDGTASVWNKDGKLTATYTYAINGFGEIVFYGDRTRIFAKSENGEYVLGSDTYELVDIDWFYLKTNIEDGDGNVYTFNGHGTVKVSDGKTYSYEITELDEVSAIFSLTFTDSEGNELKAEYDVGAGVLSFPEEEGND